MGQCWVAQQTPACTRMRKPMYTRFGEQVTRLRVLWGAFADLTRHGELWGAFGELLGSFWELLGSNFTHHFLTRHYTALHGTGGFDFRGTCRKKKFNFTRQKLHYTALHGHYTHDFFEILTRHYTRPVFTKTCIFDGLMSLKCVFWELWAGTWDT